MLVKTRPALALALTLPVLLASTARAQDRPVLNLSLDEAVKRALEKNLDIAVERSNPEASALSVKAARGVYDPYFTSTLSQTSRSARPGSAFQATDTDSTTFNFGVAQYVPTGATLSLAFNNSKTDSNALGTTFNPSFDSRLSLNLTQPLLRDLRIDSSRHQIRVAKRNREISDIQFRQTVINTLASVKQLYYDLIFTLDNLEAQRKSLTLAKKLLEENQIKVRVGTMAPLDVVAAESEVASREEGVITAETALADAEDALRRAIFEQSAPEMWALRIVPSDRPSAEQVQVDVEAAIKKALENRTDVVATRKSLENTEASLRLAKSAALPGVNLVASYGTSGLGGTQIDRGSNPLGPVIATVPGGYGDAVSEVFGRDYPTWSLGVNVSYPILNRSASAAKAQAQVALDQAQLSLRRLEMQITTEVRSAARSVEANYKRVESTRAARVLQQRRLDAEEKRFAAGMSTNFMVTQAQRDLALAEVSELRAVADYRKSQVSFEKVQEAGGSVSFASAATSTSSSRTSSSRTSSASSQQ
ncbi:MAG TPA: TolC family protein [Vicinamibacteria bacterium]|nr:TolC family protein [Vicinamibacteria bacterium]